MGAIHDQAMQYVYQQVLQRLLERMSQGQRASLQLLIQRLLVVAGGLECIAGLKVMLVHTGGRDSTHTLAFLRAAQLSLAARSPGTFSLRVATARHSDMPAVVLSNIERAFAALVVHDDPRVELLMLEDAQVRPFDARQPISRVQQQADRHAVLMAGHLSGGDADVALAHRHYLDLADLHRLGATWNGGVDVLISAEPAPQRKRFLATALRMLRSAGLPRVRPMEAFSRGLFDLVTALRDEYRPPVPVAVAQDKAFEPRVRMPRVVAVDDLVLDPACAHGPLLHDLLRYQHDEWAFAFAPSEAGNSLLRLHLRGLRGEFVDAGDYQECLAAGLQRSEEGMKRQQLPQPLREQLLDPWQKDEDLQQVRRLAGDFASQAWGVSEAQLVCLLFAPIVGQGRGLEDFLRRCHPGMLVALPYLHKALQGQPASESVAQWLTGTSGLPMSTLQAIYRRNGLGDGRDH
ncbi:hypothetical protein [Pseudomonas sp. zfem002]|uniref:hypothetical protein n=1 Tax=Pseudomonas sp. zfem002 TaxID=3078197 RepID=UPI002928400B|nr:hypothetical protein [Pseudomonas sp. zfem002]MDU9392919.1 hypothetical protein [Pseudomonas sp. zfem002]